MTLNKFIQSKIDLDKENMKNYPLKIIRGDSIVFTNLKLIKTGKIDLYIRYTCRGTGRVYI